MRGVFGFGDGVLWSSVSILFVLQPTQGRVAGWAARFRGKHAFAKIMKADCRLLDQEEVQFMSMAVSKVLGFALCAFSELDWRGYARWLAARGNIRYFQYMM